MTTPSCLNVRAYSAEGERARGGQRPGFARLGCTTMIHRKAGTSGAGGTCTGGSAIGSTGPVQYIGYMDWGFGDTVLYEDRFDYGVCSLQDNAKWSGAHIDLKVLSGYVHLSCGSMPYSDVTSGNFQSFAGDTWDDFILVAGVQWNVGTTGDITFWVSSATGAADDGMTCKITYTSTWLTPPLLGFYSAVTVTLTAEGASVTNTATWTRNFGAAYIRTGYPVLIEATKDKVRVLLDGAEIVSVVRPAGAGTCNLAGFKMSLSKPSGSPLPDGYVDFRLLDWKLMASTRSTAIQRKAVAITGGLVYSLGAGGSSVGDPEDADIGDTAARTSLLSAAPCNGNLFFVDGNQPRLYNPMGASNKVMGWTARQGTIEKATRLVANWRNRVVLSGTIEDPQNFFMSRQDDPFDFDYGKRDAQAAVAGGGGENGRIGDPITALCPLSDDVMIFGCTKSIWAIHGDPMAGGRMIRITDQLGILGQNAWTTDEQGNFYFLSESGLYAMRPLGVPKSLSGQRLPILGAVTPVRAGYTGSAGQTYITLAYDSERDGLLIYQTGFSGGTATHYFYDLRNDAFWPETYPNGANPTCAAFWNAATAENRRLVAGSRKSRVFAYQSAYRDGTETGGSAAIPSYCFLGPYRFGGTLGEAVVTDARFTFSAGSSGPKVAWFPADTAEGVTGGIGRAGMTAGAGANRSRERVRGIWHALRIGHSTANKTWAYEDGEVHVEPAGRVR